MYTREITVKNEVGLHARPATYFIQKANEFKSGIWVEKEERRPWHALLSVISEVPPIACWLHLSAQLKSSHLHHMECSYPG